MRLNAVTKKKRAFEDLVFKVLIAGIGTGLLVAFFLCDKLTEEPQIIPARLINIEEIQPPKRQVTTKPVEVKEPVVVLLPVDMDESIQEEIREICQEQHIAFPLVMAIIGKESQFNSKALGDNETSYGLMQIKPRWHQERMDALQVTDLFEPVSNVKVGVNILLELSKKYNEVGMVLMAYNMGESTASKLWQQGIYESSYSKEVMEKALEYTEYIDEKGK